MPEERHPRTSQKGRNSNLVNRRNTLLVARYYYYGHFRHRGYEEIVAALQREFFLSPATITHIVQDNADVLEVMKKEAKSIVYFQAQWEHLKW